MRINSLYIKIFLSFIALLVTAEILILAVFRLSVMANEPWNAIHKLRDANSFVIQEVVRSRLRGAGTGGVQENREMKDFLVRAGELYKARFWLEFPKRGTVIASFDGPIPKGIWIKREARGKGWFFSMAQHMPPPKRFHFPITLENGERIIFNAMIDHPPQFINEGVFSAGLAVIGIVIALVTIPVSRFISVPVKKLSRASRSIARGNLAERVRIDRNDEIGDLGRAFNDMAQRVEDMIRSIRELSAHISHELRSPLARMSVTLELLAQKEGQADRRLIQSLSDEIMEMDRLIGSILRLSRLDLRVKDTVEETIPIPVLVQAILKRYDGTLGLKSLTVEKQFEEKDLSVKGNGDDLRTAVTNIIDNAVKYTPEGGRISITAGEKESQILLAVENDSPAMKEDDLSRLFNPFFRPDDSSAHGYGLGLAITKKIIEMHGGSIKADQHDGRFMIEARLPLA